MKKRKIKSAAELSDLTLTHLRELPFEFAKTVVANFLSDLTPRKRKEVRKLAKKIDLQDGENIVNCSLDAFNMEEPDDAA